MTLGTSRIVFQGETPYAHEREAIELAVAALPNTDPFHLWALLELPDRARGRLYELDLIVMGYAALYLIEIKSGPGRYEGDHQDWYRTDPDDDRPRYLENPYRLTNLKAKVLASALNHQLDQLARHGRGKRTPAPWVEPLVFLSAADLELRLRHHGDHGVVTRDTLARAITHHEFPGADGSRLRRISAPQARDVARAIEAMGLRPRKGKAHAGAYELGALLDDGPGYQDRVAAHRDRPSMTCRARTYLVPEQTSVERRQQLRRAADREAQLLWDVREHPGVLRIAGYETDAPLGPTVLFDPFDGGVPLSTFLRRHPGGALAFADRIRIIEQVGRALGHCHRKGVVHGAVSPEAVLVRVPDTGAVEARLFNFQLASGSEVDATSHWSALASEPWAVYQAPELREDPAARSPDADVFSLGALAYLVITGQAPGETFVDVARRLNADRHLDPRAVDDGVPEAVAELVAMATDVSPIHRADDIDEWVELLVAESVPPAADAASADDEPDVDPLEAREGDTLGDDLIVGRVLGQGATSRVLQVSRVSDGREYALKVALSPEHHERLGQEAETLADLRHPRIVQLVDRCALGGRDCLLLSIAGAETLHRHLAREGTVSLDYAHRYGEDLLSALQHLEEKQVAHRDIKPANLGVGIVSKSAAHLTLFDFSLARTPRGQLQIGTAAYRDPFLSLRGSWDNAAERWSAAVTLHEMLTGVRPRFEGAAIDAEARLSLAAERFEPSVRDALVAFFSRALDRDAERRHESAEAMRQAWNAAFMAPATAQAAAVIDADRAGEPASPGVDGEPGGHDAGGDSARPAPDRAPGDQPDADAAAPDTGLDSDAAPEDGAGGLTREQLAALAPDTLIDALPLSPRARSALDRAGLVRAVDLLDLADNRLSAVRGVGSQVAREILAFRNRWREVHPDAGADTRPLFAGYRGDDLLIHTAGLPDAVATILSDAGLRSLAAVAAAPAAHIDALARRHGLDPRADVKRIVDTLARENDSAGERARPSTVEGWIDALLPARSRRMKHPRLLFGVSATRTAHPFRGRLDVTVAELAAHQGVTTAAIYLALGKAREDWAAHGAIGELRADVHAVLAAAAGALPVDDAAHHLLARIPHDRAADRDDLIARAAALIRVVAEVDKDAKHDPDGLRCQRLAGGPWICASEAHVRAVKALGEAADRLAARAVVPGQGETARVFADAAEGTPLAGGSPQRLAELAARASTGAACSTRLEIYPRGMSAERALSLTASILRSRITPEEVARRVSVRYPEALPLPPRPDLDALLAPHGLTFRDDDGCYHRPGSDTMTSVITRVSSLPRAPTALPTQALSMQPDAITARQFDDRLRNAVERRHLRVLGVSPHRAREAALCIGDRLGARPVALDQRLAAEMARLAEAGGVRSDDVVHDADRAGPAGNRWPNLLRLARTAADSLAGALLPPDRPLLLVQPGLLARYRLTGFLARLVDTARDPDAAAILLLVPAHHTGGVPRINDDLAIPGLLPSQALWVPSEWLANRHKAAAQAGGDPGGDPGGDHAAGPRPGAG